MPPMIPIGCPRAFSAAARNGAALVAAAQGIGPHGPDAVRVKAAQALAEALQALDGPLLRRRGQAIQPIQPRTEAHRFAQPVDNLQPPFLKTGHDHVEAVGAEVYRRDGFLM